jgi:hypothetical protein
MNEVSFTQGSEREDRRDKIGQKRKDKERTQAPQ